MPFEVLHSSDWHLGKRLYHKSREREFRLFLDWMLGQLGTCDLLLIAGDIFDTNTPPLWAQELYYRFLHRASRFCEIVVCAGNHDSAMFLEAPKALLKTLRVHVIGRPSGLLQGKVQSLQAGTSPDENAEFPPELLPIYDDTGTLQALVAALPYLQDSYLRSSSWAESTQDKEQKLQRGVAMYYQALAAEAERFLRIHAPARAPAGEIPLLAMGHLFASGASTIENDGVRELYIGSLGHFPGSLFPSRFDYIALGHIHQAQKLKAAHSEQELRYCGSPLAFGFGESAKKVVLRLQFEGRDKQVEALPVPLWQRLEKFSGDAAELQQAMLRASRSAASSTPSVPPDRADDAKSDRETNRETIWLELEYNGPAAEAAGLRTQLQDLARQHSLEILRFRSTKTPALGLSGQVAGNKNLDRPFWELSELNPEEVFRHLLEQDRRHRDKESREGRDGPAEQQAPRSNHASLSHVSSNDASADATRRLWKLYGRLVDDIKLQRDSQNAEQANPERPKHPVHSGHLDRKTDSADSQAADGKELPL